MFKLVLFCNLKIKMNYQKKKELKFLRIEIKKQALYKRLAALILNALRAENPRYRIGCAHPNKAPL